MRVHRFASASVLAVLTGAVALLISLLPLQSSKGEDDPQPSATATVPTRLEFNRDIRPILSENCFRCHGPDAKQRKADLRLDVKESAFAAREGYVILAPKNADASELHQRLIAEDPDERMPPPKSGKSLQPEQIERIKRWIEQGAEWEGHWSSVAPKTSPIPAVDADAQAVRPGFVRNPIDNFLFEAMRAQGLTPSPQADRSALVRRLSLDLLGLPPTPEQVAAFVGDSAPDAYERLLDRLLASPHFGERMAMAWLDWVRYADTIGYHSDNHRDIYLYRDYAINAFNGGMPFDRFTVENLAGDLLPNPTDEQKIASGYNMLLMTTEEGGAQPKEYMAKYSADRVRNASTVWLAATMGCAECHDHKYDPYSTKDFYSFAAFFADLKETAVGRREQTAFPTAEQKTKLQALDQRIAGLRHELDRDAPELAAAQADWEKRALDALTMWAVVRPSEIAVSETAETAILPDGSILAQGANPAENVYKLRFPLPSPTNAVTAVRLEVLPDDSLPAKGPGRAGNGNFVLNEFEADLNNKPLAWSKAIASHSQDKFPIAHAIDRKRQTGWAVLPQTGKPNTAIFVIREPKGVEPNQGQDQDQGKSQRRRGQPTLNLRMRQSFGGSHAIGRFRIAVTAVSNPGELMEIAEPIASILKTPAAQRDEAQRKTLAAHYRTIAPALAKTRSDLADAERERSATQAQAPQTLIAQAVEPRSIRVLPRGNWLDDSGPIVEPAAPSGMPTLNVSGRRATRLDLARWMVDRGHPLTARVFVNRVWKLMFGQGIVATPDNFGSQGSWPSHPALLDWLAVDFMENGWDVKRLIKLMASSGAYRQSSVGTAESRRIDPENRWLSRQGRFRLDAESVRDNALAIGGLLTTKIGGPSAKPYQPAGYWAYLNFPKREYMADRGEGLYRRGLYTYWCRTFLHPSLYAFDASTREECVIDRPRSNTPLQSLTLLNDPSYVEAARGFAERMVRQGGATSGDRIDYGFRLATARPARDAERSVIAALVEKHLAHYRQHPDDAKKLLQVGERPAPPDLDVLELAAWTSAARAILNLHETITRN